MKQSEKRYSSQSLQRPISIEPLVMDLRVVKVVTKKKVTLSKLKKTRKNIKVKEMTLAVVTIVTVVAEVTLIYFQNDWVDQALP